MDDLYVTFILKRKPVRAYEKDKTRHICMTTHLTEQIKVKKPPLILCLGNVAVQTFFQDPEVDVKSLRGSWHNVRGHLTAVTYHPLAIIRRPNLLSYFMEDWALLAERYHNSNG
jgi:DNA polymerase